MASAANVLTVPPPAEATPLPIETPDGRYTIVLPAPVGDPYHAHDWPTTVWSDGRFDRPVAVPWSVLPHDWPTTAWPDGWFDRPAAGAVHWSVLLQYLTAVSVYAGGKIEVRTELTSEAEARLCQQLLAYTELENNWDGDGAKVPAPAAARDALSFLANRPADIPLPSPECGTEGDLGLYWEDRDARVFAEVAFEGDGTCAYFAVQGEPGDIVDKCGDDNVIAAARWPDELLHILRT